MTKRRTQVIEALTALETQRAVLLAELLALSVTPAPEDRLLTVEEAARILSVSTDWLYRHADEFAFTIRPGKGQLRFSNQGLQDYLQRRRG